MAELKGPTSRLPGIGGSGGTGDSPTIVFNGETDTPILLLAEHAGNALPPAYGSLGLADEGSTDLLFETHWAFDIGVSEVVATACDRLSCTAICGRYTRLLIDLNRATTETDLIAISIGTGEPGDPVREIPANRTPSPTERRHRLRAYYRPSQHAIDDIGSNLVARHGPRTLLVSVHSFTPVYGTQHRSFDIGLIHHGDDSIARVLAERFEAAGLHPSFNEPYSGLEGAGFSVRSHGEKLGCRFTQVELNQRLLARNSDRIAIGSLLADVLRAPLAGFG